MIDYLLLAEKPSAAKKFAQALGGNEGNFKGKSYKIVASHGHLMQFVEPEKMVKDPSLESKYKSWSFDDLPWNIDDFNWKKTYINSINPKTKKKQSTKKDIERIKQAAGGVKTLVIATDDDPSGEGQLLGWEIVNAIKWHGAVARMYFEDESKNSIQTAFSKIVMLPAQDQDGEYVKAETRSRWDYLSMQLTRASTDLTKKAGYNVKSVRQGRLKSVIIRHISDQLLAIKNYKKQPYFEVRFKDENGHVFINKSADLPKFSQKNDGTEELKKFQVSSIQNVGITHKQKAPGKLIDLAGLAAKLAPKGFGAKEVLGTYQKLYEAEYVSYPRTEDKKITLEQFNDLLPLVDQIADVVNVDTKLLTHREPRTKHLTKDAAHGANRPGLKVPKSLSELDQFGASAQAIYEILAKNYLAILCEDYCFDQITANLADYPEFKTSFNVPVKLNYKEVFNNDSDDSDTDQEEASNDKGVGNNAKPFLFEGSNKKPTKPNMKWITNYLSKYNVGTGATRTSTLANLVSGSNAPLTEKKGVYSLTPVGEITAELNQNTWIASVKVTENLFNGMEKVGDQQVKPGELLKTVVQLVDHDLPIMATNSKNLKSTVGVLKGNLKPLKPLEKKTKVGGEMNGQQIKFNAKWGEHTFTEEEISELLAGKTISFDYKGSSIKGSLKQQTYKKHTYWGFKKD